MSGGGMTALQQRSVVGAAWLVALLASAAYGWWGLTPNDEHSQDLTHHLVVLSIGVVAALLLSAAPWLRDSLVTRTIRALGIGVLLPAAAFLVVTVYVNTS